MHTWRPAQTIKVKSLGLHWCGNTLLAAEIYDDAGTLKDVRPLGGSLEFGEDWQSALIREFKEELKIDVTITGAPLVMENIYEHEGQTGHEVLFIASVTFPKDAFASEEKIIFQEDSGTEITARWFDLDALNERGIDLFPTGLKEQLKSWPMLETS
ncbi:NUDIX hydrolase [Pseudovibrio brasiliensis]|uniref:NUDIX domain-containing protein n=1 Tax=Pseudovibrio brasiliensis TaxID=1898042 RepID=A0ABX8AG23_9HYPH|nr:NUDIX domain-containing protein [Pseudovibrio brasiliensis]QUS54037.1 NUDIX domain-containing protein [Pseudovibrio brasiliensis]